MDWYLAVLKNYAGFGGRARRKEYWMFTLFNIIAVVLLAIIGALIESMVPYVLYYIAILVPMIAVTVRRLHDTGRSAWWLLMYFVPLVGAIVMLVFMATEGQAAENKYGPNPKFVSAA
ncbi:DUF805 domain-containing protein [Streptomyces sp. MUM 178J]|uniref:DUF805 domain-containing protein n=1 Tax=Streptomyces sp. MUM 178J TaxID=2791991 RepID=UPI001F03ABCB|nr:DUF805 domain-containing protein [Streptomyces sp. MUM 178J]WRQ82545.1 DUF805 domain-containing protein [Streptomyces sp. MUM 178J]